MLENLFHLKKKKKPPLFSERIRGFFLGGFFGIEYVLLQLHVRIIHGFTRG